MSVCLFLAAFVALCTAQTGVFDAEIQIPLGLNFNSNGVPSSCCGSLSQLKGSISITDGGWNISIPATSDCNGPQGSQWYALHQVGFDGECATGTITYQNQYGSGSSPSITVATDGAAGTIGVWFYPWTPGMSCASIYDGPNPYPTDHCIKSGNFSQILQPITALYSDVQ